MSSTRPQFFPWHKLRRANDTPVAERLQAEGHQLQHPAPAGPFAHVPPDAPALVQDIVNFLQQNAALPVNDD